MASENVVIGWRVGFENGVIELHPGDREPTVGRWITSLVAGGEANDIIKRCTRCKDILTKRLVADRADLCLVGHRVNIKLACRVPVAA